MSTVDFITELFCRVDDQMREVPKHPQSHLYPGELVTLGILFALKGVSNRAFYRWLRRDYLDLFPALPERTRLFRLFATHQAWAARFLAEPTVLGLADSYIIELRDVVRARRSPRQIGHFGVGKRRGQWLHGAKWCLVLNKLGLICGWDYATANVRDTRFHPLVGSYEDVMVVFTDHGFYSAAGTNGYGKRRRTRWAEPNDTNPANLKICKAKQWNGRMLVETVLSMLTTICHTKKMGHRVWRYLTARLAFTTAMFNLLVQWDGLVPDDTGRVHLSIAHFSL